MHLGMHGIMCPMNVASSPTHTRPLARRFQEVTLPDVKSNWFAFYSELRGSVWLWRVGLYCLVRCVLLACLHSFIVVFHWSNFFPVGFYCSLLGFIVHWSNSFPVVFYCSLLRFIVHWSNLFPVGFYCSLLGFIV